MYEKPDFYSIKAKKEGYYARSIYKLKEIDEKFNLFKNNQRILELGSAPGSWSQYVSSIIGNKGIIVGIDYKQMKFTSSNFTFISGNFLTEENREKIAQYAPYDAVISDMAPDTTGDKFTDNTTSADLVETALHFSYDIIKKNGFFIAKIFQGGGENEIMEEMKKAFNKVKWFKPKSSRTISNEIFMIGIKFNKKPDIQDENNIFSDDNYTGDMPW